MKAPRTDVRIINLETAITESEDYWPGKPVLYRMHPRNIGCLTVAQISCCALANNHLLDWGAKDFRRRFDIGRGGHSPRRGGA